jgi:hypothetical protein
MEPRILRSLVLDSLYVVDEHAVAEAILSRAATRRLVAGARFRNDAPRPAELRSFHLCADARSFRPGAVRRGARAH